MEILIGLAIATVAAIGWFYGNLFVCVFLTLGLLLVAGFGLIGVSEGAALGGAVVVGSGLLIVIVWLPRLYRRERFMSAH